MLDLHVHLLGHLDREANADNIRTFLEQARTSNLKQIGFADHDMYWEKLKLGLIREVAEEYPDLQVRVGLEVDYREGLEWPIKRLLDSFPFDYVIGSVHQLDGWFFDSPGEEEKHKCCDPDKYYRQYFDAVEKAASSGLFDIIGHFDLIKIFNMRPHTDVRTLAASALRAIKEQGLVVEINTNGRYKPVKEFYPELKLIEIMKEMGIPFTLGSDAHDSVAVGRDISEVCHMLKELNIDYVVGFKQRKPQKIAI